MEEQVWLLVAILILTLLLGGAYSNGNLNGYNSGFSKGYTVGLNAAKELALMNQTHTLPPTQRPNLTQQGN